MSILVQCPGSCGELIQGSIQNTPFLVTCPINRFSYAVADVTEVPPNFSAIKQEKSLLAMEKVMSFINAHKKDLPVYLHSPLPHSKGMASSSADIGAVAMATALALGTPMDLHQIGKIAVSIEPTDATFFPGITQFDYLNGTMVNLLGPIPPMHIVVFDEGGEVNTREFNKQAQLGEWNEEKESQVEQALYTLKKGLAKEDVRLIGKSATISAFANQKILPKNKLAEFHELGTYFHSLGTIIAHSGTVLGLIFPFYEKNFSKCIQTVLTKLPHLQYVDTVQTYNRGLTYTVKRKEFSYD